MSRILVVNENPDVLTRICGVLQDHGHETIVANSAREAHFLSILWHPVDCIVGGMMTTKNNEIEFVMEGISGVLEDHIGINDSLAILRRNPP
ncbi:MAG: hypothetical protein HQL56_08475 [Magnetococcales bacterium]|nr:hypothetical protein [Magnetococcales bacterium]